jgi:hypothetical protein
VGTGSFFSRQVFSMLTHEMIGFLVRGTKIVVGGWGD